MKVVVGPECEADSAIEHFRLSAQNALLRTQLMLSSLKPPGGPPGFLPHCPQFSSGNYRSQAIVKVPLPQPMDLENSADQVSPGFSPHCPQLPGQNYRNQAFVKDPLPQPMDHCS